MMVIKEFASQLEVEFSVEARNALLDMFRLDALVLFVVKSRSHNALFCAAKLLKNPRVAA